MLYRILLVISLITLSEMAFSQGTLNGGSYVPPIPEVKGEKEFKKAHKYFQDNEYETAFYWLKKAANLGHRIAQNDLGLMYQYGIGTDADSDKAMFWYTKAVNSKYQAAEFPLNLINLVKELLKEVEKEDIWKEFFSCYIDYEIYPVIYFPIRETGLSRENKLLLNYISNEIKKQPNTKFLITGWNVNFTDTYEIKQTIRHNRAIGVKNYLIKCGVNPDQLVIRTCDGSHTFFGASGAMLDRAVTIRNYDEF